MRPEDVPSLYRALAIRFAAELGLDPDHLEGVACGEIEDVPLAQKLVTALYPLVDPAGFLGLPSVSDAATIDTAMQTQSTQNIRGARPTKNDATAKLRAAGKTISEVADALDVPYSTARSWFQKCSGGRAVPPRYLAGLRKFGIKASDLPNGVVEK